MADTLVGLSTTRELYLESYGRGITGATLTYSLTDPTGTVQTGLPAVSDEGSGFYSVDIDGSTYLTVPGLYREVWTGTYASTTDIRRDGFFLVAYPEGPATTRLELRHQTAQLLDDLTIGQAESGDATTMTDTNLIQTDDHWRGADLYFYAGTGLGESRTVAGSTSAGVITPGRVWDTSPDSNTLYELHRLFTVAQYNRALNLAILQAASKAMIPVVDETLTQTLNVTEYTVPAGLHAVAQVWTLDEVSSTADWVQLEAGKDGGWFIIPGRRILRVTTTADNVRFRLVGQVLPDQLLRDEAYADMNPDYLIFKAAAYLCEGQIRGPQNDPNAYAQRANSFHAQAEARKPNHKLLPGSYRL